MFRIVGKLGFLKKKTVLIIFLSTLILIAGYFGVQKITRNDSQSADTTELSESEILEKENELVKAQIETAAKYYQQLDSDLKQQASNVNSIEDFAKLNDTDQGAVGLEKIKNYIDTKDLDNANLYIDLIIKRDDGSGLDAAHYCYEIAITETRKAECLSRMTEIARIQGIIGQDESLPQSYYEPTEERG